tara:strand:- start:1613 stop:2527 length:915 start_codon:yes stop_codon:yes gene_type:complete
MAKLPVGYKSPFNKISSIKPSPMKMGGGAAAVAPVAAPAAGAGAQMLLSAAPGIMTALGSIFGRKKRRREQTAARKELEAAKKAFEDIEFVNPYLGLTNPYAGMENVYEDATVDMQAADYLRQQQQQSQANVMANLKGVAGGAGVAGLAQQMANISTGQARQASAQIAQQERANQQRAMAESTRIDQLQRTGQSQVDIAKMQGEMMKKAKEDKKTEMMYGLSIERMNAADAARRQARAQLTAGLGQAISGVAGTYAPGGARSGQFGTDMFNISGGMFGTNPSYGMSPYAPSYRGLPTGGIPYRY